MVPFPIDGQILMVSLHVNRQYHNKCNSPENIPLGDILGRSSCVRVILWVSDSQQICSDFTSTVTV